MKTALSGLALSIAVALNPVDAQLPETLRYGTDAPAAQSMDIYWPAHLPTAAVLFIHGGSLQESGERRNSPMYQGVCSGFVKAGVVCASIDYRLAPAFQWPAMPHDVAMAVRTLRDRLAVRNADPSQIFLFGHSSGCHLAAIVGTNPVHLATVGLKTTDIAGMIPMGCLLDRDDATIRQLTIERIRAPFMNESQDVATYGSPENYLDANPASFVGPHVPPTMVVLAELERFMPPVLEQGSRFVRMLLEHDVPANLLIVPGGHVSSITQIGQGDDPALPAILKFIRDPKGSSAKH